MAEVKLDSLRKEFGGQVAVEGLDLTIADQEFLTLVGPSGCGKSTTLRMICGLEKATSGQVIFDGEPVTHLPANKRDVSMVFQSYALYPHRTVGQNIGFSLKMLRVPRNEIEQRVRTTAQALGIEDLLDRKPKQLSGGQRQRVALGRAIIREAGAFLLDEPLSNLDAQLRVDMRGELKRLHGELNRTFIYVTHDQVEAMTMSDRIAVMSKGVLQQCGSPDEIYGRPVNTFVAAFMGSPAMNFIDGELNATDGDLRFSSPAWTQALSPDARREAERADVDKIILGVRPEDVLLGDRAASSGRQAVVEVSEPMGADVLVTLDLGATRIRSRVPAPFHGRPGDTVGVSIDPGRVHLFDGDTRQSFHSPPVPVAPPVQISHDR
ncbi:ABC transporter ATP-binding protein [Propionibacteriaceae bacterium Y1685]|uniref:ABC transporter ATP-binding protein n=1 Tax=Microlunatus sp. Y1700 TaxID=3418487 RepID=UPI003B7CD022